MNTTSSAPTIRGGAGSGRSNQRHPTPISNPEKEADDGGDHDRISFGSPNGPPHRDFAFASRCAAKRSVTT
jgi:hypothetical protein